MIALAQEIKAIEKDMMLSNPQYIPKKTISISPARLAKAFNESLRKRREKKRNYGKPR